MASILETVKKTLGIANDYTAFDLDVMTHINSVFSILNQLGIGPEDGFMIEDNTATWSDYQEPDKRLNIIKSYIYLRVRLLFDPPTLGYINTALENQIKEFEWRLDVMKNSIVNPPPVVPVSQPDWPFYD